MNIVSDTAQGLQKFEDKMVESYVQFVNKL
jgi:hypothetical protein